MKTTIQSRKQLIWNLTYAPVCIAINIALGKLSSILLIPFTMDTIGTILSAFLLPFKFVVLVSILSSVVASVVINPFFIYFTGTQLAIGLCAYFLVKNNGFSTRVLSLFSGLIIGIVSAIVSAPVIAYVFGGVAIPSISAIGALFLASGVSLWKSVLSGSLIVESLDKIFAGGVAWYIIQRLKDSLEKKSFLPL